MNYKKTLAIALLTGIVGMNVLPAYSAPFFISKAGKKTEKNTVIKSQVTENKIEYVNMDWWKSFNDEYLDQYIAKAIQNNNDLKIATLKVEQYNQMVKLQFANELPTAMVGFSPNIAKMQGSTSSSGLYSFPLVVNYEADIFLKNHDKTKSAKKTYEVSKLDERAAYISIASAVGTTYFNVVKLDKMIDVQKQIIASRKQIYELMKKRNEQGITSAADTLKANKAYVASMTDMIELKKSRTVMLDKLAVLVGDSPNNISQMKRTPYNELVYKTSVPKSISSEIIVQRPDYLSAEKQVEKAGLDVKIARKEFLPSFNILGLMFFNATTMSKTFNWSNLVAAFGGSAMLPFFTGGARFANLRIKKNVYEQVLHNYLQTNLVAIQEVNDALSTLKLDNQKYESNVAQYNMEQKDYAYNTSKYKEGIISKLDLIQHKENLLVMEKLVAGDNIDCAIDSIGLYKSVGSKL